MDKSTHFSGQPLYGQVIKLHDKAEIFQICFSKVLADIRISERKRAESKFTL